MGLNKLTQFRAANLVKAGKHARTGDGGGLWLDVRGAGRAVWVFRYSRQGKAHEVGLGSWRDITLVDARDKASSLRKLLADGVDPLSHQASEAQARLAAEQKRKLAEGRDKNTFRRAAEDRITAKEAEYRNAKHRQQWRNSLAKYVYPVFGETPVEEVSREDILRALQPIWLSKPETASRVRQRIEVVLDYAASRGWRSGSNPAIWRGSLSHLLPSIRKTRRTRHHPALPWDRLPRFVSSLKELQGVGVLALHFAILTVARSGEVRMATWGEIDLESHTWTIPGHRMKAGLEHRVPLNKGAVEILSTMRPLRMSNDKNALVFPSNKPGKAISDMTIGAVIKRMNEHASTKWNDNEGREVVPHGFRSTFRDWCADTRSDPSEVFEKAMAHKIANATEAAYRRGDLFVRRVALMEAWGEFTAHDYPSNIAQLRSAVR